MMDLVGMGDTRGNQQSSSGGFDGEMMDFAKTTPYDLLIQVIEQTLKAYSVDEKLASMEVLNIINQEETEKLQKNLIEPLLKNCPP